MRTIWKFFSFTAVAISVGLFTGCAGNGYKYDATGTFEATEVVVSSEANGKILALNIAEGDVLKANEICGVVDTISLILKKDQLVAGIAAAAARKQDVLIQTAYVRQQIETQKSERERVKRLIAANAANTKQLDDINSAISGLTKQLQTAESNIAQSNNVIDAEIATFNTQIAQLDDQLRRAHITSPIDGTVLAKYAQAGELTSMGKPLFKIADIGNMYLRAYITAGQLSSLKLGQQVNIYADSGDTDYKVYIGEVAWISDKSEFTPKTIQTRDERANLVYAVKISFFNDGYVKIGMYGDVKF